MNAVVWKLYLIVLVMMMKLVPTDQPIYRHGYLALATVTALLEEEPLYANDDDRTKTAALVVAVEFRESSLKHDAIGDGGHSYCAMQIHDSSGGGEALIDDPVACVKKGIRMLRQSIRIDRAHPVAFYARGPRYQSDKAKSISDDRVRLAAKLANVTADR